MRWLGKKIKIKNCEFVKGSVTNFRGLAEP